jgi:3-deoxy-D-manno-octulosonate 8-phosphate phosphatase (KDO 8-P phosphatase)
MSPPPLSPDLIARAKRVRLLLLDVDGVLTAGTVEITSAGGESKSFFIRDGLGLIWARRFGLEVGLLSGRASETTTRRARELGIPIVVQGSNDKRTGYAGILAEQGLEDAEVAYMGDDLVDMPVLGRVGLSAAPADAVDEVRARVHWTSQFPGGRGAVRELVEVLLRARGQWENLVASYESG